MSDPRKKFNAAFYRKRSVTDAARMF